MSVLDPLGLSSNNAFCGSAVGDPSDGWFVDPYDGTFAVTVIMPAVMVVYDDAGGGRRCGPNVGWCVGWYGGCNRGAIGRRAIGCVPG